MLPDFRFVVGAGLALALIAVTSFGLIAAVRLAHQGKVGPLEASRNLAFDDRSDWNPFYHPDSARRFDELARKPDDAAVSAPVVPADAPSEHAAAERAQVVPPAAEPEDASAPATNAPATTEPKERQLGEAPAAPAAAGTASGGEPEETGALAPVTAARNDAPAPIVKEEAPPERVATAPASAAGAGTRADTPLAAATPDTPAPAAKPARKPAPRPRVARPAPQYAPQYNQQPFGTEQQYARQPQYAPRQTRQGDPFGQQSGWR